MGGLEKLDVPLSNSINPLFKRLSKFVIMEPRDTEAQRNPEEISETLPVDVSLWFNFHML